MIAVPFTFTVGDVARRVVGKKLVEIVPGHFE
jgi:hypothetical protein